MNGHASAFKCGTRAEKVLNFSIFIYINKAAYYESRMNEQMNVRMADQSTTVLYDCTLVVECRFFL